MPTIEEIEGFLDTIEQLPQHPQIPNYRLIIAGNTGAVEVTSHELITILRKWPGAEFIVWREED